MRIWENSILGFWDQLFLWMYVNNHDHTQLKIKDPLCSVFIYLCYFYAIYFVWLFCDCNCLTADALLMVDGASSDISLYWLLNGI